MMMENNNKTYYKICEENSIILFYYDKENDIIDGIIEEKKENDKFSIEKHKRVFCKDAILGHALATAMFGKAKEIDETEYNIGANVIDSFINSPEWLIADNEFVLAKNEIVTEPVYV